MGRLKKLKPAFWDHRDIAGSHPHTPFNFRNKWKLLVLFTALMALLPLFVMTLVDFGLTRRIIEDQVKASMSKILNSAAASISFSIDRKKTALDYIARENSRKELLTPGHMASIHTYLSSCSKSIVHISLIGKDGRTLAYAGITDTGTSTAASDHMMPEVVKNGKYLGYGVDKRNSTPYLRLSAGYNPDKKDFFILKLMLDMDVLNRAIAHLDSGKDNDIFVVNEDGTLLTASFYYGKPGTPNTFNTGLFKEKAGIEADVAPEGRPVIAGYARIPDSSLILVLVKSKKWLTSLWFKPRLKLIGYLAVSIVLILLSIMGTATYLVGRIHSADQQRIEALHHAEYANKLASIGRLASGVAHEINNPLAIINQKTGLMMDLFTLRQEIASDDRLLSLADDVLDAVKRCGTITRRLLDFARHMEPSIQPVDLGEVIGQVLAFLEKEADRRNITISVDNIRPIPGFECDRGSLQQIFLNLFNNSITAMEDGGQLNISVRSKGREKVTITVSDDGCGISGDDIHKIFEPFYSSKNDHWGTGLGLSITYGLLKEIGGDIRVKSRVGEGTRFTLTLPLKAEKRQEPDASGVERQPEPDQG